MLVEEQIEPSTFGPWRDLLRWERMRGYVDGIEEFCPPRAVDSLLWVPETSTGTSKLSVGDLTLLFRAYPAIRVVLTAFLALQDIDARMGPTTLWARTHKASAHTRWYESKSALLREAAPRVALMRAGDMLIFDSRVLHCGGANVDAAGGGAEGGRRRAIFYFSLRTKAARGLAPGTLKGALRGEYQGIESLLACAAPAAKFGAPRGATKRLAPR